MMGRGFGLWAALAGLSASAAFAPLPVERRDPAAGRFNYRGGPGTRAYQRAALKRRNRARNRRACRG